MVRAVAGEVLAMGPAAVAIGKARRLRRESELEANVRELCGVLSLPGRASDVVESVALRFGRERPGRRTVPRWVHEDQCRKKPDDERRGVRNGDRSPSRRW